MKFHGLALLLLSFASPASADDSCVTLDDLNFLEIKRCKNRDIQSQIKVQINAKGCTGTSVKKEAMAMTGKANHPAAYATLRTICDQTIEACVPNPTELDFSNIGRCSYWPDMLKLITANQREGCTRKPELDASLIVRAMTATVDDPYPTLLPWRPQGGSEDDAYSFLAERCEAKACVTDYDAIDFTSVKTCALQHITNEYYQHRNPDEREGCARDIRYDAPLLLAEKYAAENPEDTNPPTYVWSDNKDDTINAYEDVLLEECFNTAVPCTAMEDLDFENIRKCEERYILGEVQKGLEGCSITNNRNGKEDLTVSGKEDFYYDALTKHKENCNERIVPCTTLEDFDFAYVNQCDLARIEDYIDENRKVLSEEGQCGSYGRGKRPIHEELLLMTGATIYRKHHNPDNDGTDAESILIDACQNGIKSCALRPGGSLEVKGCDWKSFQDAVKVGIRENGYHRHLHIEMDALEKEIFESTDGRRTASDIINATCADAWETIDTSTFSDIDTEFTNAFMSDYIDGQTHLNLNTGNFQGEDVNERDGEIGENIDDFRYDQAELTEMVGFGSSLDTCQNQAIMCCFGRDRQFGDNNGNCRKNNCNDRDPADNSNLCKTDTRAYPENDAPEKQIHCHGLAWGSDVNDYTQHLKYNNFFYVSLYDHMYSRGYVERTIPDDPANFKMCDCIENMPPVSRSDCTEVDLASFIITRSEDGTVVTATPPDSLNVQFNSCRGIGRSNDLSTYIKRLVKEGRMTEEKQTEAYKTLVGYEDPNDNNNEAACDAILR